MTHPFEYLYATLSYVCQRPNDKLSGGVYAVRWSALLCQLFDNMLCKTFIYLIMSWNGLFFARFGVPVKVVTSAMPYKFATTGSDFLDKLFSLHRFRANSFTS